MAAPRVLPACSSPTGEISYCYLGKHLECSLGRDRNCYLNLSAPLSGTRLHWKHRECSLGKHLESACSYPTGENPYYIYRKRAWRFVAPRPHALRLVSERHGNRVGHSDTRCPTPAHNTNPVSLWETDELSDDNGI